MIESEFKKILNESADEALIIVRQLGSGNNPVEAWTMCEGILDAAMRRKIKERLQGSGRNPYTGKVEKT